MKIITLQFQVKVPDQESPDDVEYAINKALDEKGSVNWGNWTVGVVSVTRTDRVDDEDS